MVHRLQCDMRGRSVHFANPSCTVVYSEWLVVKCRELDSLRIADTGFSCILAAVIRLDAVLCWNAVMCLNAVLCLNTVLCLLAVQWTLMHLAAAVQALLHIMQSAH